MPPDFNSNAYSGDNATLDFCKSKNFIAHPPVQTLDALPPHDLSFEKSKQAWLTVLGAFLSMFAAWGQVNAFGTFQAWYAENQLHDFSPAAISWIGSLQLCVLFLAGGFVGRLSDAYGPRWSLAFGTVIYAFGFMMTSIADKYYQFMLVQGVVIGFGASLLFYPLFGCISAHFVGIRALAMGIASSGSGVGGVVFPIMLRRLFASVGFAWGVRISGFICLGCCVIATLTVTSRLPTRKPGPWIDVASLKDLPFVFLAIGSVLVFIGIFDPYFYIIQYSQFRDVSANVAFYVLSSMSAGGVGGRIVLPFFADTIGRFNILALVAFLSGLSCLAIGLVAKSLATLLVFSVLYGLFSGAYITVVAPCVAQISKLDQVGARVGMMYSLLSIPVLIGEPIAGTLLGKEKDAYWRLLVFTGITSIVGFVSVFVAKILINRKIFANV